MKSCIRCGLVFHPGGSDERDLCLTCEEWFYDAYPEVFQSDDSDPDEPIDVVWSEA